MTEDQLSDLGHRCDNMHSFLTNLVTCTALAEVHRGIGNSSAVEGCQQTTRKILDLLQENLDAIRKVALPLILLLLTPLARADSFDDHLKALEARNASKPSPVAQEAVQQPRHGDTKPCTDGKGDWTYDATEAVWWRYRPDWVPQPSAAPTLGGWRPTGFSVRAAAGGCLTG